MEYDALALQCPRGELPNLHAIALLRSLLGASVNDAMALGNAGVDVPDDREADANLKAPSMLRNLGSVRVDAVDGASTKSASRRFSKPSGAGKHRPQQSAAADGYYVSAYVERPPDERNEPVAA